MEVTMQFTRRCYAFFVCSIWKKTLCWWKLQ